MKIKKIFHASFEDSLNLLDDTFIKYMINDVEKKETRNKAVFLKLIAIICILMLYGIYKLTNYLIHSSSLNVLLVQPKVNFLPGTIFYLLLVLYLIIWIITLSKRQRYSNAFFTFINTNNYLIWLILEMNLFFLTFIFPTLRVFGTVVFFCFILLFTIFIGRKRLDKLEKELFNTSEINNDRDIRLNKYLTYIVKYGWILVILIIIWKTIFPDSSNVRTDIVGLLFLITSWFIMNILFALAEIYLFLPYLLSGFYKNKYPEEYRLWEGESQTKWYGKSYFKKYIQGTEKEESK